MTEQTKATAKRTTTKATTAKAATKPTTRTATPTKKAAPKKDTLTGGTFDATTADTHRCHTCRKTLPVTKFPTISARPGVRVAECRPCRNDRTRAAKEAK